MSESAGGLHSVEGRIKELENLFIGGRVPGGCSLSVETLIDVLLVLYDECVNSSLRREKTVSDFVEHGMYCKKMNDS